ncbi:hypothetical protein BIV60_01030 [Bacillus sp. MUM 116]|uniref:YphA family membrane protein n=1 Tax=Bacillus sp. MUM 116 TaxID=1678002 RepID=UPI0008F57BF5|nr:hypothetical protein [Bacillus sp. MUM 116]OIK17139.1 hypothetical protein BIV60_01030 [Bacillus sp. MUM 116]
MEGSMFYWISWSFWVYLTFFLNKQNPYRFKLAAAILMLIALSTLHFRLGNIDIFASGLFLLFLTFILISKEKLRAIIYFFICSYIIGISYVTFHLFEIFDPIWIILKKEWMMGILLGYLAILLQKTLRGRLLIVLNGTMQGEILYTIILSKYHFPYSIGTFAYLDVCALISFLLVGWSFFENAGTIFQNHFNFTEKAKQKSS